MAGEEVIVGYGKLAKFLTEAGYTITKRALNRLGAEKKGPPVAGSWSNSYTFHPADVLAWARDRSQQPRTPRGRKFANPLPAPRPAEQAPVSMAAG